MMRIGCANFKNEWNIWIRFDKIWTNKELIDITNQLGTLDLMDICFYKIE